MEPESDMAGVSTDGEGLEEALDDVAYEYLTTEGGERYPDGCSESRKRCIRKKAKSFVVEDGEMTFPHLKKVKKRGTKKVAKLGHVPTALLMPGLVCHSHLILCKFHD